VRGHNENGVEFVDVGNGENGITGFENAVKGVQVADLGDVDGAVGAGDAEEIEGLGRTPGFPCGDGEGEGEALYGLTV
jgi:hypothetical protein